nr:immunoglobulin heavy chain junction region [Macaca mulatta]MOW18887.1 immunoglobulin heavy chain junction region [Macaca mulatta]MOW18888.1 immunoglobulin heavy chain junction region [Macaca mulatta]MOW18918.1 immunoglobulin heavy chain junction region [Macaca mulatta]MOW18930.1 immunoglobulin heavy chain junction region [Macaca mulatta]
CARYLGAVYNSLDVW